MRPLPKPVRRAAALGLLALAVGLAAVMAAVPLLRLAAAREESAAAADRIAQLERLLSAATQRPASAQRNVLIAGETSGMAGAELQRLVSEAARKSGLSLRSANVTAPRPDTDLTAIGVDVGLNGQTEALRAFLHAIETGVPILVIETLAIRAVPAYQPVPQPVALDITLRIRGYAAGKDTN
jgi:general secretion pathway protein M